MAEQPGPLVHRWPIRVYYEDTDAGGIVYHAAYLRYAERARTEMLRAIGFDHVSLARDAGVLFAVRRVEIDYLRSARLDDQLVVRTRIAAVRGASLDLDQEIQGGDGPLARLLVRLALLDRRHRPVRLPAMLRSAFRELPEAASGQ